ncbi:hypothetical protein [Enterovirga aerilata]|uniref:Uncharacterized protein n=1 Tax=Enterovirga aerilata TaxID=2730920 RepID=A0A849IGN8_9HYPH|nr:hypothetical protein [Enterovirga sp. DB1703]NNM73083.1 hypothetical protein [Enterovirga sp. DB1703]
MTGIGLDRRAMVAGLVAAAASGPSALAQAGPPRFSAVIVDVGPLHARRLGPFADFLRSALQAELARAFADRLGGGRGAPRLVVRIDGISMPSYVGREGGRFFGGGIQNDYLEGEALVVAPNGQILARHPQLSALPSNSGGAWYDERSEQRRVLALAAHYAGWLRRSPI